MLICRLASRITSTRHPEALGLLQIIFCVAEGVAQISNLLYRRFPTCRATRPRLHPADWKSAIQQIGNLRYKLSPLAFGAQLGCA
jgi:hypothetical protein